MAFPESKILRLGTRGSLLAKAQSKLVADQLMSINHGLTVELAIIKTTGDIITDQPLSELGGKGLFTKEIELALLSDKIDFAVHSLKDVPVTMPLVASDNLIIAAVPYREDAKDALISRTATTIAALPKNARVGTGSLRRKSQLLAIRDDLQIELLRGNLDTRLGKLRDGEFDAIILAMAGLRRSELFDEAYMFAIDTIEMLPAAGQGALALQCRRDDVRTVSLIRKLDDSIARTCAATERAVILALNGDCHSPIAAFAEMNGDLIQIRAAVAAAGGGLPVINASGGGAAEAAESVVANVVEQLCRKGARELLRR